jgi:hypothetical protein
MSCLLGARDFRHHTLSIPACARPLVHGFLAARLAACDLGDR